MINVIVSEKHIVRAEKVIDGILAHAPVRRVFKKFC